MVLVDCVGAMLVVKTKENLVCIKMEVKSQRRKILFHTTNMAAMTKLALNLLENLQPVVMFSWGICNQCNCVTLNAVQSLPFWW